VKLDLSREACMKKDPVSHWCVWDEDQCPAQVPPVEEVGDIIDGTEVCQIGAAGQVLQFVFKDGNECTPKDPGAFWRMT
jgi:hypothetical protein